MDYRSFHLTSDVTSMFLEVHPTHDFLEEADRLAGHQATQGGRLHSWRSGSGESLRWTLPLEAVNSSDRTAINSAWRSGDLLGLTFSLSHDVAQTVAVRIVNEQAPLPLRRPGRPDLFAGNLFLRQADPTGKVAGGPFILDDAVWGLLDQSYNVLI